MTNTNFQTAAVNVDIGFGYLDPRRLAGSQYLSERVDFLVQNVS